MLSKILQALIVAGHEFKLHQEVDIENWTLIKNKQEKDNFATN